MTTIIPQNPQQDPQNVLDRIEVGERIVVSREGRPVIEIRKIDPVAREPRPFGLAAGAFTVPDDFDDQLSEDVPQSFEER